MNILQNLPVVQFNNVSKQIFKALRSRLYYLHEFPSLILQTKPEPLQTWRSRWLSHPPSQALSRASPVESLSPSLFQQTTQKFSWLIQDSSLLKACMKFVPSSSAPYTIQTRKFTRKSPVYEIGTRTRRYSKFKSLLRGRLRFLCKKQQQLPKQRLPATKMNISTEKCFPGNRGKLKLDHFLITLDSQRRVKPMKKDSKYACMKHKVLCVPKPRSTTCAKGIKQQEIVVSKPIDPEKPTCVPFYYKKVCVKREWGKCVKYETVCITANDLKGRDPCGECEDIRWKFDMVDIKRGLEAKQRFLAKKKFALRNSPCTTLQKCPPPFGKNDEPPRRCPDPPCPPDLVTIVELAEVEAKRNLTEKVCVVSKKQGVKCPKFAFKCPSKCNLPDVPVPRKKKTKCQLEDVPVPRQPGPKCQLDDVPVPRNKKKTCREPKDVRVPRKAKKVCELRDVPVPRKKDECKKARRTNNTCTPRKPKKGCSYSTGVPIILARKYGCDHGKSICGSVRGRKKWPKENKSANFNVGELCQKLREKKLKSANHARSGNFNVTELCKRVHGKTTEPTTCAHGPGCKIHQWNRRRFHTDRRCLTKSKTGRNRSGCVGNVTRGLNCVTEACRKAEADKQLAKSKKVQTEVPKKVCQKPSEPALPRAKEPLPVPPKCEPRFVNCQKVGPEPCVIKSQGIKKDMSGKLPLPPIKSKKKHVPPEPKKVKIVCYAKKDCKVDACARMNISCGPDKIPYLNERCPRCRKFQVYEDKKELINKPIKCSTNNVCAEEVSTEPKPCGPANLNREPCPPCNNKSACPPEKPCFKIVKPKIEGPLRRSACGTICSQGACKKPVERTCVPPQKPDTKCESTVKKEEAKRACSSEKPPQKPNTGCGSKREAHTQSAKKCQSTPLDKPKKVYRPKLNESLPAVQKIPKNVIDGVKELIASVCKVACPVKKKTKPPEEEGYAEAEEPQGRCRPFKMPQAKTKPVLPMKDK